MIYLKLQWLIFNSYYYNIVFILLNWYTLDFCVSRYRNDEIICKMQDIRYEGELLKYIHDKNVDDIQLTKKEYTAMIII